MRFKKKLCATCMILLFAIVIIRAISNEKVVYADKTKSNMNSELLNYNYQFYENGYRQTRYFYLITKFNNKLNFKKLSVKNNDVVKISVKRNQEFIISLHANITINSKWSFYQNFEKNKLAYLKTEWLNIIDEYQKKNPKSIGYSAARQFFYFKAKQIGESSTLFKYKDNSSNKVYFEFILDINSK